MNPNSCRSSKSNLESFDDEVNVSPALRKAIEEQTGVSGEDAVHLVRSERLFFDLFGIENPLDIFSMFENLNPIDLIGKIISGILSIFGMGGKPRNHN